MDLRLQRQETGPYSPWCDGHHQSGVRKALTGRRDFTSRNHLGAVNVKIARDFRCC